jgi:hypothetical protein
MRAYGRPDLQGLVLQFGVPLFSRGSSAARVTGWRTARTARTSRWVTPIPVVGVVVPDGPDLPRRIETTGDRVPGSWSPPPALRPMKVVCGTR